MLAHLKIQTEIVVAGTSWMTEEQSTVHWQRLLSSQIISNITIIVVIIIVVIINVVITITIISS